MPTQYSDDEQEQYKAQARAKGVSDDQINDFLTRNPGDVSRLSSALDPATNRGPQDAAPSAAPSTPQSAPTSAWGQQATGFYDQLMQRAGQSLDVNPNDQVIRGQTDAYRAEQTRASRGYLDDLAERSGPTANLLGEQRLAAERVGQSTSGFQAELMGREVSARRDEIAQALQLGAGVLSDQQRMELQRELTLLDNQLRSRGMDQQNDQFLRELALREWDIGDQSDYRWASL